MVKIHIWQLWGGETLSLPLTTAAHPLFKQGHSVRFTRILCPLRPASTWTLLAETPRNTCVSVQSRVSNYGKEKKMTVQYTTEFGVKGAVNRTRQHLSPGGASERVQDSGSVGVPASNTPKNCSCWTDWNVMWILSSFYFTLSTVQKWKHAHAIKSKHSHPARLTRCLLTEAKGLSGSHRKVCKSKETSNKHLTMLTEIQRRKKKLSKVSKSCLTHILRFSEFVVKAQKAKTTSSQRSLADKDDSLSFTGFSKWKETALTSVYWDTNLLGVVRGQVMEKIKTQKPFKLIRTQYWNRLNIH